MTKNLYHPTTHNIQPCDMIPLLVWSMFTMSNLTSTEYFLLHYIYNLVHYVEDPVRKYELRTPIAPIRSQSSMTKYELLHHPLLCEKHNAIFLLSLVSVDNLYILFFASIRLYPDSRQCCRCRTTAFSCRCSPRRRRWRLYLYPSSSTGRSPARGPFRLIWWSLRFRHNASPNRSSAPPNRSRIWWRSRLSGDADRGLMKLQNDRELRKQNCPAMEINEDLSRLQEEDRWKSMEIDEDWRKPRSKIWGRDETRILF